MFSIESLQRIQEICSKPKGRRTKEDISYLVASTKDLKVFEDLIFAQGISSHEKICQYLLYEFVNANDFVFRYGDIGTKFYIILEGRICIHIPGQESMNYTEIMTIEAGKTFGEISLETSKPRGASAICKRPSYLLYLEKKEYAKYIQRVVSESKQSMITFLQTLPIFSQISKIILYKLTYNIKEKKYFKRQIIFKEGEGVENIYIIRYGECKLCKYFPRALKGNSIKTTRKYDIFTAKKLGNGAMIGEDDSLNNSNHSYSCICCSDAAILYSIPTKEFLLRINDETLEFLKKQSIEKYKLLEN